MSAFIDHISRAVPPPEFLRMPAVGLDISDDAIKFVELERERSGVRLKRYDRKILPKGTIIEGKIQMHQNLLEQLQALVQEQSFQFVHASLPEEHAYLFQTDIPHDTPFDRIRTTLEFTLKENVPLMPDEVVFDFDIIRQTEKALSVAVSVYPRAIVEEYLSVFTEAGLSVLSLETEGQANARAIVPSTSDETVMMIDIGKLGTVISIISHQQLVFATTAEVSGDDFTRAIERFLQISFEEAEKVKEEKGFVKSDENNDLFEALLGEVSTLRDSVNKHMTYWHMHGSATGKQVSQDVSRIVLCGGGANLKGLRDYMRATMSLPVEVANVWTNIATFDDYIPNMNKIQSLQYATSMGLSLKSLQ